MRRAVTSDEIAVYQGYVRDIARRYARRPGVEMDDLMQEGLIDVFLSLRRNRHPSAALISRRMRRWCKRISRQRGYV